MLEFNAARPAERRSHRLKGDASCDILLLRLNVSLNTGHAMNGPSDMLDAADRFRRFLAERGMRLTAQRRLVLQEALRREGHFDAEEFCAALREAGGAVSRATVYRTLRHLRDCGLIREMPQPRGPAKYEHLHADQHHDHMVCIECGRVIEFFDDTLEAVQERVCWRHGFKAMDHRMSIRGLCRACRQPAKKGRREC